MAILCCVAKNILRGTAVFYFIPSFSGHCVSSENGFHLNTWGTFFQRIKLRIFIRTFVLKTTVRDFCVQTIQ